MAAFNDSEELPQFSSEQNIWKEFIETLETLPELWDVGSNDYMNKVKRMASYGKLLEIMKKINPEFKVGDVRKKINTLRSNYRKELKKIHSSKVSGAAAEDVYTPKSWKFHSLHFLNRIEQPVGLKNVPRECEPSGQGDSDERGDVSDISFSSINEPPPPQRKKKSKPIDQQNELIKKACSLLSVQPDYATTKINATALYWSEKLERLNSTQRSVAEKAINDILFEGEQGNLSRNCVKIDVSINARNAEQPLAPSPQHIVYQQFNENPTELSSNPSPEPYQEFSPKTNFYESSPKLNVIRVQKVPQYRNHQNTKLSLNPSPESNIYQELPPETNLYEAAPRVNIIRVQKPVLNFVPPPTPSPDSNFSLNQPTTFSSSPQLPASGHPNFVYQTDIGATEEIGNSEEYSIRSLFSSFDAI